MTETTTAPEKAVARGKVSAVSDGIVTFHPAGTNYELRLLNAGFTGPLNTPVKCTIHATARKVYTVPSGGNYITPIFGPPRIVQGRVLSANNNSVLVHAGCPIQIQLPAADSGIDLDSGPLYVGRMINVVCLPGVRVEFI
jgi:hypothetical protein